MKTTRCLEIILCLSSSLFAAFEAAAADTPLKFSISRGSDLPVCRAFLDALNSMQVGEAPLCNRKEPAAAPALATLHRAPLSPEEIYRIAEPLIGFAEHGDAQYFSKLRAQTDAFCTQPIQPRVCQKLLDEKKRAAANGARWMETYGKDFFVGSNAWKYRPEVDIDNDGIPDSVLMLTRDRCGSENYKGVLELSSTFAFVMDKKYESVDEERTRSIFGHPTIQWPGGLKSERFRYVGSTIGIFSFANRNYFFTYLTSFSDFENQRFGDDSLQTTLDVILDEKGVRRSVCEYRQSASSK